VQRQQQPFDRHLGHDERVAGMKDRVTHQVAEVRDQRDARVDEGVLPAEGAYLEAARGERVPRLHHGAAPAQPVVCVQRRAHGGRGPYPQLGIGLRSRDQRVGIQVVRVLMGHEHRADTLERGGQLAVG
jgi:hypothetical protein